MIYLASHLAVVLCYEAKTPTTTMHTRLATPADGATIQAVYAPYVENTTYTFEFKVPTVEEVCARMRRHPGYVWLVAEHEAEQATEILGYAYAWPFEEREGYRFAVETSIFIRQDRIGGGIGRMLYADLLASLKQNGFATAVARIALPNPPSERLHEKLGFKKVAHFERIGHKFDRWIDIGYWQRSL
jgi:phosphinothricin acetyltransferase